MIFRGMLVVVEALFWLLVLRLVLRALGAAFAPPLRRPPSRPAPRAEVRAAEDLVQDRVCHTYVPLSSALSARVGGREEHFCSTACRDRALAGVARAS